MKNDKENIETKEKQQNKEEETTDQILKDLDFDKEFEKLKEVWNRPLNLPRDVDWDKVFKAKRPKFHYKKLFVWKCLLLVCYLWAFAWLSQYFFKCLYSGVYMIPYVMVMMIFIVNIWWYMLYIVRIWNIDIYNDSLSEIEEKKASLLLMEKYEWMTVIILLPIFILTYLPVSYFVLRNENFYNNLFGEVINNLPIIALSFIGEMIYYQANKKSIKLLKKETNNNFKFITIKFYKPWQQKVTI